jgi:tyrosyl-tRNA synthetase
MSIPDSLTEKYLRLVSGLSGPELDRVLALKPRDAKAALARQLVKRLYGDDGAGKAEAEFDARFRKREAPEEMGELAAENPADLVSTIVQAGFAKSRGDARRLIDQGGIRINSDKASADSKLKDGDVLQAGKRNFVRIRVR